MEENKLYKTGNLISTTVFNRAIEIYNGWDEYVTDNWGEDDDFNKSDFYEEDSSPSIEKIIECVGDEFMWPKMHQYPEDVLPVLYKRHLGEEYGECSPRKKAPVSECGYINSFHYNIADTSDTQRRRSGAAC